MARLIRCYSFLNGVAMDKKYKSARRQSLNRSAASQSSQRETLKRRSSPLLCTGFRHSACRIITLLDCYTVSFIKNDGACP